MRETNIVSINCRATFTDDKVNTHHVYTLNHIACATTRNTSHFIINPHKKIIIAMKDIQLHIPLLVVRLTLCTCILLWKQFIIYVINTEFQWNNLSLTSCEWTHGSRFLLSKKSFLNITRTLPTKYWLSGWREGRGAGQLYGLSSALVGSHQLAFHDLNKFEWFTGWSPSGTQ